MKLLSRTNLKGVFIIMNDLMNTVGQTPIEIALGIDENGMTTARKLYEFLGMDKSNYSR